MVGPSVVRLRLALRGQKHAKIFHLVATPSPARRDGKPIEVLGVYDPRLKVGEKHKTVEWSVDRIKYWLRRGASPSLAAVRLLTLGGILTENSIYHKELSMHKQAKQEAAAQDSA